MGCTITTYYPIGLNYYTGAIPRSCGSNFVVAECDPCLSSPESKAELDIRVKEFVGQKLAAAGVEANRFNTSLAAHYEWDALKALVLLKALDCSQLSCLVANRLNLQLTSCKTCD